MATTPLNPAGIVRSLEVRRKGVTETVELWPWGRLASVFRSGQRQVTITQSSLDFLNQFLCIVVPSIGFQPVILCLGCYSTLQAFPRPSLPDAQNLIEVVSQHLFRQLGSHVFVLPTE